MGVLRDTATAALGRKHRIKQFRDLGGIRRDGRLTLSKWFGNMAPRSRRSLRGRHRFNEARHEEFANDFRIRDPAALEFIQVSQRRVIERVGSHRFAMGAQRLVESRRLDFTRPCQIALFAKEANPPDKP
ncbi:MAG TPA: hypothetical protein VMM36_02595 [Opitutaceae bacterium]|nr:hypothetical protein [Opitutaceae bacterium]